MSVAISTQVVQLRFCTMGPRPKQLASTSKAPGPPLQPPAHPPPLYLRLAAEAARRAAALALASAAAAAEVQAALWVQCCLDGDDALPLPLTGGSSGGADEAGDGGSGADEGPAEDGGSGADAGPAEDDGEHASSSSEAAVPHPKRNRRE
jgi:hypothetical protein